MKKKKYLTYLVLIIGSITIGVLCTIPQYNKFEMQLEAEDIALDYFEDRYGELDYKDLDLENTDLIFEKSKKGFLGFLRNEKYKMKYYYVYKDWNCDVTVSYYFSDSLGTLGPDYYVSDISYYPKLKK